MKSLLAHDLPQFDSLFPNFDDTMTATSIEVPLQDLQDDLARHYHAVQTTFMQTNLISDGFVSAVKTDPNLINPWGVAYSATSPFWIADNNTGLSSIDKVSGGTVTLNVIPAVTIAPPSPGAGPASPTG